MNDIVPRKRLVKYGMQGAGGAVGGIALLALSGMGALPSVIVGGLIGLVGLGISTSKDDRTAGLMMAGAGAVTALTAVPVLGGIAGTLLTISGIGLLVVGGLNLFKFIKGYRNRG